MNTLPALAGWDNFYVIVGSAAAGLTGLTFVVVALAADANMTHLSGLKTFVSPTVIHFSSALWITAICSVPRQTVTSLGIIALASGSFGVAYTLSTMYRMASMDRRDYVPVLQDWIWNGALPLFGYALLGSGGGLLWFDPAASGYLIGLSALLLVFVGIHNVWDLAVWILAERPSRRRELEAARHAHHQAQALPPGSAEDPEAQRQHHEQRERHE
ncbi:MAG TPA: hypothetical protein VMF64_09925 [Steroidobacteraceae bacterium]|nr:hypothetical protein [Steroidobacteraceae bacterium]